MTKIEKAVIVKALKASLAESDEQWANKVSHAQIIGYLQGTIKGIISHLDSDK